ncbi:hypothetical protein DERF_005510 [Dermatophagoides farinae]|uniref:Uncharacterized protein n=1 Tax=Dermatophagoides farinae TaxID=6954 RepID=A0A922L689_DERFA|nr:hypothetical protein DERF_005510 [Dermatophagoides farinae]
MANYHLIDQSNDNNGRHGIATMTIVSYIENDGDVDVLDIIIYVYDDDDDDDNNVMIDRKKHKCD